MRFGSPLNVASPSPSRTKSMAYRWAKTGRSARGVRVVTASRWANGRPAAAEDPEVAAVERRGDLQGRRRRHPRHDGRRDPSRRAAPPSREIERRLTSLRNGRPALTETSSSSRPIVPSG